MLEINFSKQTIVRRRTVLVCVKRNKNKVLYNSGLIYFNSAKAAKEFKDQVTGLEVIDVDIKMAHAPKRLRPHGIYCPYCQEQMSWPKSGSYRNCPICGMSDNDFWVKKYNKLEAKRND